MRSLAFFTHKKDVLAIELELISAATKKDEIESSNEQGKNLSQEDCKIIQIPQELSRNFKLEIICLHKQQT